jgi:hypothetical protein
MADAERLQELLGRLKEAVAAVESEILPPRAAESGNEDARD